MLDSFLLSPLYIFSSFLAFSHQVELKSEVMFVSGELSTDTEIHGKGNFTSLQHLAYDLSKSYLYVFNFRHCEGALQAALKSAELLTEHKVHCMQNVLCEWSLWLETLWGRTYLLAVISIRMIFHSDDVFPFSPRCIMKEISTRCILQQKQKRGRKSVQH